MCKHTSAIAGPCSSYIGMRDELTEEQQVATS
nr:MAG TPA: hypothetical protein [Caudoviricetes sp.]